MTVTQASRRAQVARALAQTLLQGVDHRWEHTMAVALRAEEVAGTVPPTERDLLLAAAWLHDIGYSPKARDTGFHPLDGARYLERQGWPARLCALVAHHSGASFAADSLGLRQDLEKFPNEQTPVSDALTYADQTTGPRGQRLSIGERMAEMLARHGASSVQARIHPLRAPFLLAAVERVELRLSAS